jgi:hypothetical protein
MDGDERTQEEFFKVITKKKLHELLLRADEKHRILQKQINTRLSDAYCITMVKKNTVGDCSIYIYFYNKNTRKEIGYLSFHLYPQKLGLKHNALGRFHGKNRKNTNFKYTLRVNKRSEDSIIFSLTKHVSRIRPEFEKCTTVALGVLNSYFNELSPYWLGHSKFANTPPHICHTIILRKMEQVKQPIRNTRKRTNTVHPLSVSSIVPISEMKVSIVSGNPELSSIK